MVKNCQYIKMTMFKKDTFKSIKIKKAIYKLAIFFFMTKVKKAKLIPFY